MTDSMGRNGKMIGRSRKIRSLEQNNFSGPLLSCCLGSVDVVSLREEMYLMEHFLLFTMKVKKKKKKASGTFRGFVCFI